MILLSRKAPKRVVLDDSEKVYERYRRKIGGAAKECIIVVALDTKLQVLREEIVAVGTHNGCAVMPAEVLAPAVAVDAHAMILVHNHPSGIPDPSPNDDRLTERVVAGAAVLGVKFSEHVIVARDRYYSYSDNKRLPYEPWGATGAVIRALERSARVRKPRRKKKRLRKASRARGRKR